MKDQERSQKWDFVYFLHPSLSFFNSKKIISSVSFYFYFYFTCFTRGNHLCFYAYRVQMLRLFYYLASITHGGNETYADRLGQDCRFLSIYFFLLGKRLALSN